MSETTAVIWDWPLAEALAHACDRQALWFERAAAEQRRSMHGWAAHWYGRARRSTDQAAQQLLRERELLAQDWRAAAQQLRAASARARAEQQRRAALAAQNLLRLP